MPAWQAEAKVCFVQETKETDCQCKSMSEQKVALISFQVWGSVWKKTSHHSMKIGINIYALLLIAVLGESHSQQKVGAPWPKYRPIPWKVTAKSSLTRWSPWLSCWNHPKSNPHNRVILYTFFICFPEMWWTPVKIMVKSTFLDEDHTSSWHNDLRRLGWP